MDNRVVVKLGSDVTTDQHLESLLEDISRLRDSYEFLVVSSGAGKRGKINGDRTDEPLPSRQARCAVGQIDLMHAYQQAAAPYGMHVAQVLLTPEDFSPWWTLLPPIRRRRDNMFSTLETLLNKQVLPIINENDTVATAEIQFGDNDILGALVARGMQARQYIMLSTANGFQKHGRHVSMVDYGNIRPLYQYVSGEHSENGTGGMRSKLDAARLVTRHGMTATIASGNEPHVLARLLEGHRGGLGEAYGHVMSTRFLPRPRY